MTQVELGSDEWVALADAHLREAIPALGSATDGLRFSMCEVFTAAPAHIADADGDAAWWFEIDGPSVSTGRGRRPDADVFVEVDYTESLDGAWLVYDLSDPEIVARLEARAAERRVTHPEATAKFEALPPAVRAALTGLHNYLAPRTA